MNVNDEIIKHRSLGLTQKEISALVGCSESNVWLVLKNARLTERKMLMSITERLERRIKKDDKSGCWIFQGSLIDGYGQIKVDGKSYRVHRLTYSLFVGEIPSGMIVCHKCDNPPCCNPDHLFIGTHAENIADRVSKGRCAKGDALPNHKITEDIRAQIFQLKKDGLTHEQIGAKFSVTHATISRVLNSPRCS
jgi:transcriptional regulator